MLVSVGYLLELLYYSIADMIQSENTPPRKNEKHSRVLLNCKDLGQNENYSNLLKDKNGQQSRTLSSSIVKKSPSLLTKPRPNLDRIYKNNITWKFSHVIKPATVTSTNTNKVKSEKLEISNRKRFTINRKITTPTEKSKGDTSGLSVEIDVFGNNNNENERNFISEMRELINKVEMETTTESKSQRYVKQAQTKVIPKKSFESEIKELLSYVDESKIPTEVAKTQKKENDNTTFQKYHETRFGSRDGTRPFIERSRSSEDYIQHRTRILQARKMKKNTSLWKNVILKQHFNACQRFRKTKVLNKTV